MVHLTCQIILYNSNIHYNTGYSSLHGFNSLFEGEFNTLWESNMLPSEKFCDIWASPISIKIKKMIKSVIKEGGVSYYNKCGKVFTLVFII